MIQPGSLVGFGLMFLAISWVSSAILGATLLAFRGRIRRAGPRTERALSSAALIVPPLAAATLVIALGGLSLGEALLVGGDHCASHRHHLHLCLLHGGSWIDDSTAVLSLFLLGAVTGAGAIQRLLAYGVTRRLLIELERHSEGHPDLPSEARLVPSETPLCIAAGLVHPRILISTASWSVLSADERIAVLAHEKAHIEHGDTRWRIVLSLLGALGSPGIGPRLLEVWTHASERLCDWRASSAVDEPTTVALALVRLARAASTAREPRIAETLAFASHEALTDRVEAILHAEPDGATPARRAIVALTAAGAGFIAAALLFASPLHHAFETLLHF